MADGVALRLNQRPYTGQEDRLLAALALVPDQASGLAVREGRRLGPGLEVTISADGLNAVVQPGVCAVNHALAAGGDYWAAFPAVVNKALAAKPATGQKRRDTVVVDVSDADVTQKPTALREANIVILAGVATSGTPTAPAAGTMQFEIAQVAFDGTNTPTINPTNARFTWAAGGIGVVFSQAERNALTAYDGLVVYRRDLNLLEIRRNGAWERLLGVDTGWFTYAVASGWTNAGTRMRKVGNKTRLEVSVVRNGAVLNGSVNNTVMTLDAADRPGVNAGASSGDDRAAVGLNTAGNFPMPFRIRANGEVWVGVTSGLAVANGDVLRVTFEYYSD